MLTMPLAGTDMSFCKTLIPTRAPTVIDPLDDDQPTDDIVVTTRRAICRVALVATEVAHRFQREAIRYDAMSWMLAPRALFGGASAVEACLDRDACLRGVLIHGLSLGLDADAAELDALAADDAHHDDYDDDHGFGDDGAETSGDVDVHGRRSNVVAFPSPDGTDLRLFTATVVSSDGFETVQAFHASLASEEAEVAGRLYCRIGAASADAKIVEGFDPTDPLVAALVSEAISDTLSMIATQPASPIAAGLDLNIEQRFYA